LAALFMARSGSSDELIQNYSCEANCSQNVSV